MSKTTVIHPDEESRAAMQGEQRCNLKVETDFNGNTREVLLEYGGPEACSRLAGHEGRHDPSAWARGYLCLEPAYEGVMSLSIQYTAVLGGSWLRFSTRASVEAVIAALTEHADATWPLSEQEEGQGE